MKKDKIIEFKIKKKITAPVRIDFFRDEKKIKLPLSQIIKKILPELRRIEDNLIDEHIKAQGKKVFIDLLDHLEQKYEKKKAKKSQQTQKAEI